MPVSHTIECTLREPSIVTNEETEQADVPQNEHPPVPQNEHPPVFLSYRKLRFHTIKTLRADRTAAEWKNVACATRRRRRILLRRILFYVHVWRCVCAYPSASPESDFSCRFFAGKSRKKVEKPLDTAIKSTYTRRACIGRGFYFDARKLL